MSLGELQLKKTGIGWSQGEREKLAGPDEHLIQLANKAEGPNRLGAVKLGVLFWFFASSSEDVQGKGGEMALQCSPFL